MYITLLCVGKIKEKYWQAAIDEYAKRLAKYHQFKIVTVADEKDPAQESDKAICALKDKEAERLARHIKDDDFVITLEIGGKELDTLALADTFRRWEMSGHTHLVFVIGGSYGLGEAHPPAQRFRPFLFQAHLPPPAHARHFLRAALPLRPCERWTEIS